jgi:AraC-like DNA-binding protein
MNNSRLKCIKNWPELARGAKWSATTLAKRCGISRATLRRYFLQRFGKTPKVWLAGQRQGQAKQLLAVGASVKEIAASLGYKQQTNFTRQFKAHHGFCPTLPTPTTAASIRIAPK